MGKWLIGVVLGFLLSATGRGSGDTAPPGQPQKPLWHTDYEQAKEMARRQGKPLCVVFC